MMNLTDLISQYRSTVSPILACESPNYLFTTDEGLKHILNEERSRVN